METLWLIVGFDMREGICSTFVPRPGLFRTREEAVEYIRRFSDEPRGIMYGMQRATIGKVEVPSRFTTEARAARKPPPPASLVDALHDDVSERRVKKTRAVRAARVRK